LALPFGLLLITKPCGGGKSRNMARSPKRPGQSGTFVGTRLQPEMLKLIDDWRREQPDLPSRPEALRRLAMKGLNDGKGADAASSD